MVTSDGSIVDTAKAFLELGATDASTITATSAGGLDMENPDTDIGGNFVVSGSTHNFNNLQGSLGLLTGQNTDYGANSAWFGFAGPSNITSGTVADHIWDTGGTENITLSAGETHAQIFYSQFQLDSNKGFIGGDFQFAITNDSGGFTNNLGAGPGLATVTGFVPGASTTELVDFNVRSWGFDGTYLSLVKGDLNSVESEGNHFANVFVLNGTGGDLAANSDLIAIQIGQFANAQAAAASLASPGAAVTFASGDVLAPNQSVDMLIAFQLKGGGTEIADAHILNSGAGNASSTEGLTITGVGLVKLSRREPVASRRQRYREQRRGPLQHLRRNITASGSSPEIPATKNLQAGSFGSPLLLRGRRVAAA